MSWKMSEKPKTVLASKSLVDEFANMDPAPYDRPLSERRMMVYERILKAGNFRVVTWASVHCLETNCTYRVNGKHTSLMLSKLDKIPEFYVTLERYSCETLKDVGRLYNTFDSNLSSRTTSDINAAFASTISEFKGVPLRLINLTVAANAYLKWSSNDLRRVSSAERAEQLMDRVGFVSWLQKVVPTTGFHTGSLTKHLLRSPVAAAMMATYDKAPRIAEQFWIAVRDESFPDRDDPTRALARFLVRAALASGDARHGPEKKMVGFQEMYVKCIRAWNASRTGEPTSLQYRAKDPLPKIEA